MNCFPAVDSVIPVVTDVAKKPSKSKRIFSETINGKDDDDDMPISTLASNAGVNHTLQQAYDSIESPIVVKKRRLVNKRRRSPKKLKKRQILQRNQTLQTLNLQQLELLG